MFTVGQEVFQYQLWERCGDLYPCGSVVLSGTSYVPWRTRRLVYPGRTTVYYGRPTELG